MAPSPPVSVVIPTLGRRAALDRCLACLEAQTFTDFDVVLVCNRDAPDPADVARRLGRTGLRGQQLSTPEYGAAASRNTGWRAASGDLVIFVDDDVLADPGLVAAHVAAHERHPEEAAGVLGTLRWARSIHVTPFMRWLEDGVQFDYVALEGRERTGWWHFYTCNVSVKRSALERVGGFDAETFPFGYEDLDIARRMHDDFGFFLVYDRDASAEHEHEQTVEQWQERMRLFAPAERRFVARYPDVEPHLRRRMEAAVARPQVRGRAARLAPYVPRWVPRLGDRVWAHAEAWYAQQLAGPFLEAWRAAGPDD